MQASGFVLAGGRSKRMGRDKALLPYGESTLVEQIARTVKEAAGSVALIGDPEKLGHLGLPVFPDELPGSGPASGVYTLLRATATDWNLVVGCDMPAVTVGILRLLLSQAETADRDCVAASGPDGQPEPLCAVYHRRSLSVLTRAIGDKRLRMRDFVKEIGAVCVPVDQFALVNVNTPAEWTEFEAKSS
jgi:molybdenum cofactor guanylyltransferase